MATTRVNFHQVNTPKSLVPFVSGSAENVVVVGAIMDEDERASYSNDGKCITLFAPGDMITGAFIIDEESEEMMSGTSLAAAHVSG